MILTSHSPFESEGFLLNNTDKETSIRSEIVSPLPTKMIGEPLLEWRWIGEARVLSLPCRPNSDTVEQIEIQMK